MMDKNLNKIPTEIKRSENGEFEEPLINHGNNFSPVLAAQRLVSKFDAHKFMEFIKPQELYYSTDAVKDRVIATMVYKDFTNRLGYGPDDEVKECLSYNGEMWAILNKYSFDNYDKNFTVQAKEIFQTLGFVYAIIDAAEQSLKSNNKSVYIYDGNDNVICGVSSKQAGYATITDASSNRVIGTYKFEWLSAIQASTIGDLVKKITTNIEYICDKLLDNKYNETQAAIDISKLSQNIRSFM